MGIEARYASDVRYKPCHNYAVEKVCNWMVPADSADPLCHSCRLTAVIPNLKAPRRRYYWFRMEAAKRRLLYTLAVLGLRVDTREENPETGLQFEFLENRRGNKVLTGHDNGLITMNIAEANDVRRERVRVAMREPYRTLLGHFRHEIGHYYFDRLVAGTPQLKLPRRCSAMSAPVIARPWRATIGGRAGGLGRHPCQRLRDDASVGGLGGNVGALPAYRRYDRYRAGVRDRHDARESNGPEVCGTSAPGSAELRSPDEAVVSADLCDEQPESKSRACRTRIRSRSLPLR